MTFVIKWYNNQIQELSLTWVSVFTLWEIHFMNHEIFGRGKLILLGKNYYTK